MDGNGVVADDLGPPPRLRIGSAVHNGVDEHGLGIGREPHMHRGDVSLDHGPVMLNGTLPASNSASMLVASTSVDRALDWPSVASSVAPLIEQGLFTITLLWS
jgi:hypothetical protein